QQPFQLNESSSQTCRLFGKADVLEMQGGCSVNPERCDAADDEQRSHQPEGRYEAIIEGEIDCDRPQTDAGQPHGVYRPNLGCPLRQPDFLQTNEPYRRRPHPKHHGTGNEPPGIWTKEHSG
ncbi:hypothetical protein, partial [Paenibacillus polymyxa]|uniref:hypothetical protein n=1 Tax=Paenibacillus polymyxa TaxID=1406 RepID=UPI0018AD3059